MKLVFQIAAGILIAGVLTLVVRTLIVTSAMRSMQANATASLSRMQADTQARIHANEAQRRRALEESNALKRETAAQEIDRRRKEAERNQAWESYYKQPAKCENPPTWEDQVDCGNHFIRAKRQFEAEWQTSGK